MSFDFNDRMASVTKGATTILYYYDASSDRSVKFEQTTHNYKIYPNKYFEDTRANGKKKYIFLGDLRLGTIDQTSTTTPLLYLNFTDHLNSSGITTDSSGNITNLEDYLPFGSDRVNVQLGTFTQNYKFTDKELDPESGLQDFGARFYNNQIGRFVQQDPLSLSMASPAEVKRLTGKSQSDYISNPQNFNTYAYALNNPILYVDPLGLFNINSGEIERGDTLSAITEQINKYYNTNLTLKQIAEANSIKNINLIYAGDKIALPNEKNLELRFDNKNLQAYDSNYGISYNDLKWAGVSGNKNNSPIPEGTWGADPKNTQYFSDTSLLNNIASSYIDPVVSFVTGGNIKVGSWPGGPAAWGTIRTELSNNSTGQQNTGYYIHGGDGLFASPGSAGCIDLMGGNYSFQGWFNGRGEPLNVIVKY